MNKPSTTYSFFDKKEFHQLADKQETGCVSIYMPTQRAGKEVDEGQGQLILKNCLQEISAQLSEQKHSEAEVEELLRPAKLLLDDVHFWRNQSDGLAIFLCKGEMQYYTLPLQFKTYTYTSNHFYLKPLIPFFNGDGHFYLLKLSQHEVVFFEASRYAITEIVITDLVPDNITELIDLDSRHYSSGKDDYDKNLEKFFRAIDDGLMNLISDKEAPLVLACQNQYYPIYKEITNYTNLYNEFIPGNPDDEDILLLHEKAWSLMKGFFQQNRIQKIEQFENLLNTEKASSETNDIICAAVEGRLDTLFIQAPIEIYGLYDKENRTLIIDQSKNGNVSLTNLAAVKSYMQGAEVYLVHKDEMPLKGSAMNAIFRY
jgi:hypothetical protein